MLAIQCGIAKYHCIYTQGLVASQTSGVVSTHPVEKLVMILDMFGRLLEGAFSR